MIQADVYETLRSWPSDFIPVGVADPPYGTKLRGVSWDQNPEYGSWLGEAHRVLAPGGVFYVFGKPEIIVRYWNQFPDPKRLLVWHYRNRVLPNYDFWQPTWDAVVAFSKGKPLFFRDAVREPYSDTYKRLCGTVRAKSPGRFGDSFSIYEDHGGSLPKDVIIGATMAGRFGAKERVDHPTQKPAWLMEKLILSASLPNEVVLDLYAGSGTTSVAAARQNRQWLAVERDPKYCALLATRIAALGDPGDGKIRGLTSNGSSEAMIRTPRAGRCLDDRQRVDAMKLLKQVHLICRRAFEEGTQGRALAAHLGVAADGFAERVLLGYAEPSLLGAIPQDGAVRDALLDLGLLMPNGDLAIAKNLIVPILDRRDVLVGLVAIDKDGGERRFPATASTITVETTPLRGKPVIFTDRMIQALRYKQAGVLSVVPLLGALGATEEHFLKIERPQRAYCDTSTPEAVRLLQKLEVPCYELRTTWPTTVAQVQAAMDEAKPLAAGLEDAVVRVNGESLTMTRAGRGRPQAARPRPRLRRSDARAAPGDQGRRLSSGHARPLCRPVPVGLRSRRRRALLHATARGRPRPLPTYRQTGSDPRCGTVAAQGRDRLRSDR